MVAVANPGNGKSIADASPCARVDVDFSKALQECLDQVGPGRVATCGAIARALGDIRAARSVATWLNTHPDTAGSHRVVRADGRPVLVSASSELEREGFQLVRGRVSSGRLVDGHGRLHPALFGIACYVGVRLDLPTIGVAKHPLVGRVTKRGHSPSGVTAIEFRGQVRGYAWTPPGCERPNFVSVGHRISLD